MSKEIEAIKFIRQKETYHFERAIFCKEHNMVLDEIKHREIENELRRIASKLEDILDTGYVSYETNKTSHL